MNPWGGIVTFKLQNLRLKKEDETDQHESLERDCHVALLALYEPFTQKDRPA